MSRRSLHPAVLWLAAAPLLVAACGPASKPGDWSSHMGDVPFRVGDVDSGLRDAETSGRPPAYFFTANW